MIVGFTGKLGSGKDVAAQRLATLIDLPHERIAFADKLKESAAANWLGQVDSSALNRWKNDPFVRVSIHYELDQYDPPFADAFLASVTVREFLQHYGTEAHRDLFGDDFWVDAALPDLGFVEYYASKLYTITDVRFPNELKRVHELGGIVVRINGLNEGTSTHASEQVLEGVDWEIDNTHRDDDFAWLDSQLKQMIYIHFGGETLLATSSGLETA